MGRDSMCKGPGAEGNAERLYDRTGCLELEARGLPRRGHLQSRSVVSPRATEPLTEGLLFLCFQSQYYILNRKY